MKWIDIRLMFIFIIGIITGVFFKIQFNDSIIIGVMIGLLGSYTAMVSVVRELEKNNFLKENETE